MRERLHGGVGGIGEAVAVALVAAACAVVPPPTPPPATPTTTPPIVGDVDGPVAIGGGRSLEAYCEGTGSPAVILDAGLGNTWDVWNSVIDLVSPFTRVCAYDRAGIGRSDPGTGERGAAAAVDDLQALLGALKLAPPLVVVGASFGGLDAQLYARRYPQEVAGVVLVDAIPPGWDDTLEPMLTPQQVADRRAIPNGEPISNEEIRASERAVPEGPPFPQVPLAVIRHGAGFDLPPGWPVERVEALWTSLQEGLATLSPQSVLLVATTSHHRIHQTQPDLVADAIHAIVDPSRWPPAGPTATPPAFGSGAPGASLAPSGGLLAYGADDGIHFARLDGSADRIVVPRDGSLVGQPTLDASGTRVAFTRSPAPGPAASGPTGDVPAELWLLDLATGERRRLADDAILPAISPDGSAVAFSHHGHAYLASTAADAARPRDLGEGGCTVWSPDGARLAMCTPDDAVFLLDPATGARTDVDAGAGPNQPGAWSPDGSRLAITSTRGGDADIYVVGLDGSPARRLAGGPGNQAVDAWTPAGILATSSQPEDEVSGWFLVDPASGLPADVAWLHGRPNPIAWSPGRG